MEGRELQADKCLRSFPKFPLWIIEYVWAHKMMDIREVIEPSDWPEVDSQPLSIEDSWRLRVASAQVYSIVKNRDMEHFERVMGFLEATYRLLPRLVAPIKHMKIMFGLKTMVIMRMLRDGRGIVDTLFKITQFFPSKLPQYQDQCNQRDMFLMRKNNLDFKALAQSLAMDKDKLEDYVEKQMEKQYGEHYAQKVEDRLLHYLHQLAAVLPGDTVVDKILKKGSPVTEEEKLLLEVITSDSTTIAAALRKALHCEVASCRPARACQSTEHGATEMESAHLSNSAMYASSSMALLKSVEGITSLEFQPEVFRGGREAVQQVSKDSLLLLENVNYSDATRHRLTEEDGEVIKRLEEVSSDKEKQGTSERSRDFVQEAPSSPQFCSKHQRWVKSILQECPDECSEELLLRAKVSSSPLLFQSSSSTSSSQDLTPSDLVPCPPDQQHSPSQTISHPQTAAQVSEQANPKDMGSSGLVDNASQMEPLPQASLPRDPLLPALLNPVVRLIDIASVRWGHPTFKPHQASPNHFIMSGNEQATSPSSPQVLISGHCHTSRNKDSKDIVPISCDASTFTSCQTPTLQSSSRLSRKRRQAFTTNRHSQTLDRFGRNPLDEQFKKAVSQKSYLPLLDFSVSWPSTHYASTSASQSGTLSSGCTGNQIPSTTKSSRQVPQNSIRPHPQTHNASPFQSKTLPCSTVIFCTFNSDSLAVRSETCRVHRAQLRLSLPSQTVLLQSALLQPYVSLTRLSTQECYWVTSGRSSARHAEPVSQGSHDEERKEKEEEEESDSSFDVNTLYSSHSSSSDSEGLLDCDPDYKPCIKKKRLFLEHEHAGCFDHIYELNP